MPRIAPIVPAESSLLCEGCGYVLDGLPGESRCPECGRPIQDSAGDVGPFARKPPAWEVAGARGPALGRFLTTTAGALFHPARFFRTLPTRGGARESARFGRLHWLLSSLLMGSAAYFHWLWYIRLESRGAADAWPVWVGLVASCWALLGLTTHVAAKLSAWEAHYRGLRLPYPVVLRGLHYHAAHYLPVGLLMLLTVLGYKALERYFWRRSWGATYESVIAYHVVLGVEVVLAAGYLFKTYWIGMRNMMYANR